MQRAQRLLTQAVALATLGAVANATSVYAADAVAGRTLFRQQCTICHTAEAGDSGGAQGPSLQGVYGSRAASDTSFTYTAALRSSHLLWDAGNLDRFLEDPARSVPGTAMAISVPAKVDRDNLIAY